MASTCCTIVCVARSSICASSPVICAQVAAPHALGGQLDRRQRILDLVREAARHFAPGRIALRLQQRADVVEHDHVAALADSVILGVFVTRQRRAGAHQHARAGSFGLEVHLLAPFFFARARAAASTSPTKRA